MGADDGVGIAVDAGFDMILVLAPFSIPSPRTALLERTALISVT